MQTTSEYSLLRTALGDDWQQLDPDTQQRFSERADQVQHYTGIMSRVHCSALGRIMALGARLLRAPLIPYRGTNIPIDVTVTPDAHTGIVTKYRAYHFPNHAPLAVTSLMRHDGALGYTECVGSLLAMALRVYCEKGDLCFESTGYFLVLGKARIRLPHWMTPGTTRVVHHSLSALEFSVSLTMDHPWFGRMFEQIGTFTPTYPELGV